MTKPTPTPWCLSPQGRHIRLKRHGYNIASMNDHLDGEWEANARLIVHAVNSHEAMKEALDDMLQAFGHTAWESVHDAAAVDAARAALALARGDNDA